MVGPYGTVRDDLTEYGPQMCADVLRHERTRLSRIKAW